MDEIPVTEQDIILLNVPDDQKMATTFGEYRKLIHEKDMYKRQVSALAKALKIADDKLSASIITNNLLRERAHAAYRTNM